MTILIMPRVKLTLFLDLYAETLMPAVLRSQRDHIKHWSSNWLRHRALVCSIIITPTIS